MPRTDGRWDGRWFAVVVAVLAAFVGYQENSLVSFLLACIAVYMFASIESSKRQADADQAKAERQRASRRSAQEREAAATTRPSDGDQELDVDIEVDAKSVLARRLSEPHAVTTANGSMSSDRSGAPHRVQSPTSGAWHPCQCSVGRDHLGRLPRNYPGVPAGLVPGGLLARIEAERELPDRDEARLRPAVAPAPPCSAHPTCGPGTRVGSSGHGHGPNPTTGRWCFHFNESWIGRVGEWGEEGSGLWRRQVREAERNGTGDNPWLHKTYDTEW